MLRKLLDKIPHFDITRNTDGTGELYLRRYFLLRSKLGNVYLHNIVRCDKDPDPHDHPWDFVSVLLRGGYEEFVYDRHATCSIDVGRDALWPLARAWRYAPSFAFRRAETVHQIKQVRPNTWSLVITGPIARRWGFWPNAEWQHWRAYLGLPAGAESGEFD